MQKEIKDKQIREIVDELIAFFDRLYDEQMSPDFEDMIYFKEKLQC